MDDPLCHIKVTSDDFHSVVTALKGSNPSLFGAHQFHKESRLHEEDRKRLEHRLRTQNLLRLTGYDETDEAELLAVNPGNIQQGDEALDISHLLARNQCDFEHDIIIEDDPWTHGPDPNHSDNPNHNAAAQMEDDGDIEMDGMKGVNGMNPFSPSESGKAIELRPTSYLYVDSVSEDGVQCNDTRPMTHNTAHVVDGETLLTAQIAANQTLTTFMKSQNVQSDGNLKPSRKRKHDEDDGLLFRARKRRKSAHPAVRFNISSDFHQRLDAMTSSNSGGSPRSGKGSSGKQEDDDLELLLT